MISIIIPVYNHTKALFQSLFSVSKQTYKDFEVILVDDGSTDKFEFKTANFQFPIRIIRQEHLGAPAARNRGFRESKGDYVIFWDADVIADSSMLEKMVKALAHNPEASFVYSNFYFGHKKMPAKAFDIGTLKKNNYITTTSLIRRESAGQFDESLKRFQDWDLWLTLVEQGKHGIWIPEYLFRVLPHLGGMSFWLPSFAYKAPFKYLPFFRYRVAQYEAARQIVMKKHNLQTTKVK
ncbi:MAG: glycosyltransferase family 2 protein [Candidatus Magasanikbacteria bacterium]|nr:glycosyltransferase family 2 protein [Candidatus Magasanikbacteria bacterium]